MDINGLESRLADDRQKAKELRQQITALERQRSEALAGAAYGLDGDGDAGAIETKLAELQGELDVILARLPAGEAELRRLEAKQQDDTLDRLTAELHAARVAWLTAKREALEARVLLDAASRREAGHYEVYRDLLARVRALGGHVTDVPALIGATDRQLREVNKVLAEVQA